MAFLKILTGSEKGRKVEIDRDEMVIGRLAENAIPITDRAISSRHCKIIRDGRKFTLKDLDSTNGTRLNGVTIKEHQLSPKDIVTVGEVDIQIDGDDIEAFAPAPVAPTTAPQMTVRITPPPSAASLGNSTAFQARRDSRWIWIMVLSIFGVVVVIALGFFLFKLFG